MLIAYSTFPRGGTTHTIRWSRVSFGQRCCSQLHSVPQVEFYPRCGGGMAQEITVSWAIPSIGIGTGMDMDMGAGRACSLADV